ncbi:hypothetical protein KIH41_17605 [Litoribacter ruber]|uniref:Uncharacterized protein n=1 Tax=Litoribacter ruber TaxID=702568 RepID=A0AAP2G2A7_9BACT|nr:MULTISPECIES: hypothetical protein [Litoribacter]MBS9525874.1 hypothetical protein [Litoribacter alkaliphilus]MBT0813109.1 hypothetical protein [Litoribacter ruber]
MNQKRIFGPLLTLLGIGGLIYGAILFLDEQQGDWKTTLVFFVLGLIFFSSGLGLIKRTDDKS